MPATKTYGSVREARKSLKKRGGASAGILVRLTETEEEMEVRFLQEPDEWSEAWSHWIAKKFYWCSNDKKCEYCESDQARKLVLANVIQRSTGKVVVVQMAPSLADDVLRRYDKFGDSITGCDWSLSRSGTGLGTKYRADALKESKVNFTRYQLHDIGQIVDNELAAQNGDDPEEEDEEPRSSKRRPVRPSKPARLAKRRQDEDEEEDDDYEDDVDEDDEEEEEEERPKRRRSAPARRPSKPKRRHPDEDDEEDDEDEETEEEDEEEEERPRPVKKKPSSRRSSDGYDEFKPEKSRHPQARRRPRG
jgi:hypothetical protein